MNVIELGVYRAAKLKVARAHGVHVTEVFSLMYRGTDGKCLGCGSHIPAGDKRGRNHSTGDEYCRACWPVK